MKAPDEVVATLDKQMRRRWAEWVLTEPDGWPITLAIGSPARRDLERDYQATFLPIIDDWGRWENTSADSHVTIRQERRIIGKLRLDLPTHLDISTLDVAAVLVGKDWATTISTARHRLACLRERLGGEVSAATLRTVTLLTDTDFDLLLCAVLWLRCNDITGLTARQVPVPGLHAKWLDAHHSLILTLLGWESLGLVDRPQRIDVTYLDPGWRQSGRRLRDSLASDDEHATVGYTPQVLIIAENRDSALFFPPVANAVIVEGFGNAILKRVTQYAWVRQCPCIVYWGDIDADGFEILARLRQTHPDVHSILMDRSTYARYVDYGVRSDQRGKPIPTRRDPSARKMAEVHLGHDELALYEHLCDPAHDEPLRIEQERIPLPEALRSVCDLLQSIQDADVGMMGARKYPHC